MPSVFSSFLLRNLLKGKYNKQFGFQHLDFDFVKSDFDLSFSMKAW